MNAADEDCFCISFYLLTKIYYIAFNRVSISCATFISIALSFPLIRKVGWIGGMVY